MPAAERPSSRERVGWALVTLALLLGVAEGALRLYTTREGLLYTWERPDGVVRLDAQTGALTLHPGSFEHTKDGPYGWAARVNAQGLRMDGEVSAEVPPDAHRWLLVGDSWAYGVATRQDAGLAARLERALGEVTASRTQVINGGVPGASAWDAVARARDLLGRFAVHGVVLKVPVNHGSEGSRAAARVAARRGPPPDLRLWLSLRRLLALTRTEELRRPTEASRAESRAAIRAFAEEQRAAGRPLVVLIAPRDLDAAGDPTPVEEGHAAWGDALEGTGAWLAAHALRERSCFGWQDRSHPSESGAEALARTVARVVRDRASLTTPALTPSCDAVDAVGPGKAQPVTPIDPRELLRSAPLP